MKKLKKVEDVDEKEHELLNNKEIKIEDYETAREEVNKTGLSQLLSINKILDSLIELKVKDEEREEKEIKWKFAAVVMDRFLLIVSAFIYFILFIASVMNIPNLYKPTN